MMPRATVLDRARATLVVVDIQERLAATMERREQVLARSNLAIRVAGIVGLPVVVTRQYPKGLGEEEPEIAAALEDISENGASITRLDKVHFDCFSDAGFCEAIAETGRTQLLIIGMETHICVAQTALAGVRRDLEVHVAADACCSRSMEHHDLALVRLAHAGVVITNSESAAYELVGCAGTEEFKALLSVVKG